MLLDALTRAEAHDQYAALWLGAECASLMQVNDGAANATCDRLKVQARALGYAPLVHLLSAA